jgi:hypothetical protein
MSEPILNKQYFVSGPFLTGENPELVKIFQILKNRPLFNVRNNEFLKNRKRFNNES